MGESPDLQPALGAGGPWMRGVVWWGLPSPGEGQVWQLGQGSQEPPRTLGWHPARPRGCSPSAAVPVSSRPGAPGSLATDLLWPLPSSHQCFVPLDYPLSLIWQVVVYSLCSKGHLQEQRELNLL